MNASHPKRPTLKSLGEVAAIERIRPYLRVPRHVVRGVGDDGAVVRPAPHAAHDWVLTSDAVIEGVHFPPETPPRRVGHKAVGRVLSDLAAMAAEPRWALVNLVAPAQMPATRLDALYAGIASLADRFRLAVVGGDMAEGPRLELHVFALGRVPRGRAVLRSGARPGDALFVTGALGGSRLAHHLAFEPRVPEGLFLRNWATAMMDISDGLVRDAGHLAHAGRVGVRLLAARIPISKAAAAMRDGQSSLDHALFDGEDFELLFAVPPDKVKTMTTAWRRRFSTPCVHIGVITNRRGRVEREDADGSISPLPIRGYEHFTASGRRRRP